MKFGARKEVSLQFQVAAPVFTIGWILAILVLVLAVVFWFIGVPDPKVPLLLIGVLALARLI